MRFRPIKTPILRSTELSRRFGVPRLYIKDESQQPFGTWKDRRSRLIIKQAVHKGIDKLVMITSGNSGYSLARFAEGTDIKVSLVIDRRLQPSLKKKLKRACHQLIETDLSKKVLTSKELIALARESTHEKIMDVSNSFEKAFESIIDEIKYLKPDYIICPVGSGEGLMGLYQGIRKNRLKSHLVGIAPKNKRSIADKLTSPWSPYAARIETMQSKQTILIKLPEQAVKTAYTFAKRHLACEPSSAIVFGAFKHLKLKETDAIVLIHTGKG